MYLFQKAGKNLLKNKGRNIIMFVMLSIVATASIAALTIWNITGQINKVTENYFAGEVSLNQSGDVPESELLTIENYKLFVDSDFLRSYSIYRHESINVIGLSLLDGEFADTENGSNARGMQINARAYGMLDEKSMDDFSYGERVIIEGVFPTDNTGCMISSDLAALNNLTIGDRIVFEKPAPQSVDSRFEVIITGIFSDATIERRQANHRSPALNARNDIIVTADFFPNYEGEFIGQISFLLKDSRDLEAFQEELYAKGLPKGYAVQYDMDNYDQASAEIKQMSSLVSAFMGIIAFIGVSIIFLINLFALRERKYEIGVLRAIGMPKQKVMLLLTGEMLILALIAIVIAVIAGIFVNPPVVDYMIKLEMNHELPSALKSAAIGIDSAFSVPVTAQLIVLTLTLVILAGSATIGSIMRFDPIKILSERN